MREAIGRSGRKPNRRMPVVCAVLSFLIALTASGGLDRTAWASIPVTVGQEATVTNTDGDAIRIRQGPGTEYAQLGVAYAGQTVSVLDGPRTDRAGNKWFKVEAQAATGWMAAEFLEGTGIPTAAANLTGTARVANTNGDPLRLREAPSTSGDVLTLLDPGTKVTVQAGPVVDKTGIAWYKVTARGITGWAMAQYLAQEPNSAPAERSDKQVAEPKPKQAEEPPKAEPPATTQNKSGATSDLAQYRLWMEEARQMYPYPQSVDKMWRVMMCESGGNPRASGGGGRWLGLFQYAPATWGGSWNPYRNNSIWDAKSQIFATAKAWSIGMQSHWSCFYKT